MRRSPTGERIGLGGPSFGEATTRWLVRFGYDGTAFGGWARQPGRRTVEGEILRYLGRHPRVGPARSVEVASRTDRGVSAVGNALTLTSDLAGPNLLKALNGIDRSIYCTAASEVPEEFRVRRASVRQYRYFEPIPVRDIERVRAAACAFAGRVDVRSFGRRIPSDAPVRREVGSVLVRPTRSGVVYTVRAPSFVWGMVRKIVGALREIDAGRLTVDRLASALSGEVRLTLPMAEPEPLVLWDVTYPLPWQYRWEGPNRHQRNGWEEAVGAAELRQRVLRTLARELPFRSA